jgi:RNA-directed DNA polymerase
MARVAARVVDKRVLKLIRAFLNAGVMEDGLVRPVEGDKPQGCLLSPILSNLALADPRQGVGPTGAPLLQVRRRLQHLCSQPSLRRTGHRPPVSRFLTNKLRLKANETKSAVARPEERKILGINISNNRRERASRIKAVDKFKAWIRHMPRRTRESACSR